MPDTPLDLAAVKAMLDLRRDKNIKPGDVLHGPVCCTCDRCLARRLLAELSARDAEVARLRGDMVAMRDRVRYLGDLSLKEVADGLDNSLRAALAPDPQTPRE